MAYIRDLNRSDLFVGGTLGWASDQQARIVEIGQKSLDQLVLTAQEASGQSGTFRIKALTLRGRTVLRTLIPNKEILGMTKNEIFDLRLTDS